MKSGILVPVDFAGVATGSRIEKLSVALVDMASRVSSSGIAFDEMSAAIEAIKNGP